MARIEVGNVTIYYNEKSEWASRVAVSMLRELEKNCRRGWRWRRKM